MKKNSITDYLSYIACKLIAPLVRALPLRTSFFLGKKLGELVFCLDGKHKAIAYANIKRAFGDKLSPRELDALTREFYANFGQSLIELFLIPKIDKDYLDKHVQVEGAGYVFEGLKKGKGVILLSGHAGSWELSNIICAHLGFPFSFFVREQRYPWLDSLLNAYRSQKDYNVIQRQDQLRKLVQVFIDNEVIGMTIDQGGKAGELVQFFGRESSMAYGAVKMALKHQAVILPVHYTRIKGPDIKVFIGPAYEIKRTGDMRKDIRENLQALVSIFEQRIRQYPKDYLWTYKSWKYGKFRDVLILSDNKAGHLRQAQAVAGILENCLGEKGVKVNLDTVEIKFKNKFFRSALACSSFLGGRYACQGCLRCLDKFLDPEVYSRLIRKKYDLIISCGSSTAAVNYILSGENGAKSIAVMRPGILSTRRFNLVVMPEHDRPRARKNIVVTQGALNLIDQVYLKDQAAQLMAYYPGRLISGESYLGLLIGGDTKNFRLTPEIVRQAVIQIKAAADKLDAFVLVSTSRRTSVEVENILKAELKDYPRLRLLIIANENNIPQAIGGILGLSRIVLVSPESISMVSEAAESGKYVLVFNAPGLDKRHKDFLSRLYKGGHIYFEDSGNLSRKMEWLLQAFPEVRILNDKQLVKEAINKII